MSVKLTRLADNPFRRHLPHQQLLNSSSTPLNSLSFNPSPPRPLLFHPTLLPRPNSLQMHRAVEQLKSPTRLPTTLPHPPGVRPLPTTPVEGTGEKIIEVGDRGVGVRRSRRNRGASECTEVRGAPLLPLVLLSHLLLLPHRASRRL